MKNKKISYGTGLMAMGLLLLAAALFWAGFNLWDSWRAERAAQNILGVISKSQDRKSPSETVWDPDMELPCVQVDGISCVGILEIPALELSLPVLDPCTAENLRKGPCRYGGTPYEEGFVVAGHNYRTHFGMLQNLRSGDMIYFTDLNQNKFSYSVETFQVLSGNAVGEILTNEWDLTLFTCTYSGQSRFAVRCLSQGGSSEKNS